MHQITAAELRQAIELDPAWANTITEAVEITDHCDLSNSRITHLSPLLHFTGKNKDGECATFQGCGELKTAEGTFASFVSFAESGIQKIKDLVVQGTRKSQVAANFYGCKNLTTAEGTFHGFVSFHDSGIRKIGNLNIHTAAGEPKANFGACPNLRLPIGFDAKGYLLDGNMEKRQKALATAQAQKDRMPLEI